MRKNILITGIGGNVGYGILRNLAKERPQHRLIGINIDAISAGNHLCDNVYKVPFATEKNYIPVVRDICNLEKIDLIISSTDFEGYELSKSADVLPLISVSEPKVLDLFLDKYRSYRFFTNIGLPFVQTKLISEYSDQWSDIIVKPREGRGSRGIEVNPLSLSKFDDSFIIQPLLPGTEFTSAIYRKLSGEIIGPITFKRELSNGATDRCEVIRDFDDEVRDFMDKTSIAANIKGSCNLQFKVSEGGIIPFELNCRISGTNSIRNEFGFKDVIYTVDELLFNQNIKNPNFIDGSAIRIIHDIIYPTQKLDDMRTKEDNFHVYGI